MHAAVHTIQVKLASGQDTFDMTTQHYDGPAADRRCDPISILTCVRTTCCGLHMHIYLNYAVTCHSGPKRIHVNVLKRVSRSAHHKGTHAHAKKLQSGLKQAYGIHGCHCWMANPLPLRSLALRLTTVPKGPAVLD